MTEPIISHALSKIISCELHRRSHLVSSRIRAGEAGEDQGVAVRPQHGGRKSGVLKSKHVVTKISRN